MKEFNLSEKISKKYYNDSPKGCYLTDGELIRASDVKEFIRRLKEKLNKTPLVYKREKNEFDMIIDKLAGEKLK